MVGKNQKSKNHDYASMRGTKKCFLRPSFYISLPQIFFLLTL